MHNSVAGSAAQNNSRSIGQLKKKLKARLRTELDLLPSIQLVVGALLGLALVFIAIQGLL